MNVTPTATIEAVCYYAPGVSDGVTAWLLWSYWYLIGYGLGSFFLSFSLPSAAMTIIGTLIQTGLVLILWFIMYLAKWARPVEILSSPGCSSAMVFFDSLNRYGATDPVFAPTFIYQVFICFMLYRSPKRSSTYFLIPLLILAFILYTVNEFVLGRIYVAQYFVNLSIILVISPTICVLVYFFYEEDAGAQLNGLLAMLNHMLLSYVEVKERKKKEKAIDKESNLYDTGILANRKKLDLIITKTKELKELISEDS